jgi:hypothetical protein
MRKLMLACAGAAAMSGVLSVILWRDLRHERALNAELQMQLADERGQRAGALPYRQPDTPATPSDAGNPASPPPSAQEIAARAEEAAAAAAEAYQRSTDRRRSELNDPRYRANLLMQTRQMLAREYAGLMEELNLTAEEADKLFGILAEREVGRRDTSVLVEDLPDDERLAARENALTELDRKRDEALAALLGTRLQRFKEYNKHQPGWVQVADFNQLLGTPLNASQSKPLAATLAAEQKRIAEELRTRVGGNFATLERDPVAQARLLEEFSAYQAEANRRTLESARGYLTPRQLEVLQSMLEQQRRQMNFGGGPRVVWRPQPQQ